MTSAEQYPSNIDEESFVFSFDMLDYNKFQSDMMHKFFTPEALFISSAVPHIVLEDLFRAGAVSQPVTGGSRVSWCNPSFLAELRVKNEQATNSESN